MDFENAVILSMLARSSGLTMAQLRTRLFAFYGNIEAADRASIKIMQLNQGGLVRKYGLPATYEITPAGTTYRLDFETAIERYRDEFRAGC